MGRLEKLVISEGGVDRRKLGYYSTPDFISRFMTKAMLAINPHGRTVLDPCVGKEEMIGAFLESGVQVDGIDVYEHSDNFSCNFQQDDFIELYRRFKHDAVGHRIDLKYDYYIANPPYNCHEVDYIRNNKEQLNELFGDIGTRNMYSMFLSALIDCAKEGALISVIISDSFLTAKLHAQLRSQIIHECSLHYLILCPADLFRDQKADVRTCVIILQKGKQFQGKVRVLNRPATKAEFKNKLGDAVFVEKDVDQLVNQGSRHSFQFMVDVPTDIQSLFLKPKLGELFPCVTGISTGNDSKFIAREQSNYYAIPFYKNPGSRKFYSNCDGFLAVDYLTLGKEFKTFLVRNRHHMLQEGITCSSMGYPFGACYLPTGSTFGVNANIFPERVADTWWLLSYLNSSLVTYFVRGILIRSNMITSGYVARIPVIDLTDQTKDNLTKLSREAYVKKVKPDEVGPTISAIDEIIFKASGLSASSIAEVVHFARNLQALV